MSTKHRIIPSIGLFMLTLLFGCTNRSEIPQKTVEPSPTYCPPPTPIVIVKEQRPPVFLFVLVENTSLYYDSGYVEKAHELITQFLGVNTVAGDRVVAAWLTTSDVLGGVNRSIFFDKTVEPLFIQQATSTPMPTLTPISTPTLLPTKGSQLGATSVAVSQATINANVQATQTVFYNLNNCVYNEGQKEYVIAVATADANQLSTSQSFSNTFSESFSDNWYASNQTTKPIFEGVFMASNFLHANCSNSKYHNCVLLILSDMKDFRQGIDTPDVGVNIDLQGIDTFSILFDCRYKDGDCEKRISDWDRHFSFYKANGNKFPLNNGNILDELGVSLNELTLK